MRSIGFRFAHSNPFKRNHCVVHAFTHLAGGDTQAALKLAEKAYAARRLTHAGVSYATSEHLTWWAASAGLRVVRTVRLLRTRKPEQEGEVVAGRWTLTRRVPTLERFAREHPKGKYLVLVHNHAVAVIDGLIFGSWRPRSQVKVYAEVEAA